MIPDFLKDKLSNQYDNINDIIDGYLIDRYTTIRVNTIKSNIDEIKSIFDSENIKYESVSFYKDALVIINKDESDIIKLDVYNEGKIYMQSLSSMIPPIILNPKDNENILDMTAAPGSKTSQIAALADNKCLITAVEKDKYRCERLKYNLEKLGVKKVSVLNKDANLLDDYFLFDKILLDAPCSGSGTLNKENINSFSEELINKSIKKQRSLINKAISILKKDGILVYSTCSILREENEDIINEVLKENKVELIKIDNKFNDILLLKTKIDSTLCIKPTKYFEGFFVAILKKL